MNGGSYQTSIKFFANIPHDKIPNESKYHGDLAGYQIDIGIGEQLVKESFKKPSHPLFW